MPHRWVPRSFALLLLGWVFAACGPPPSPGVFPSRFPAFQYGVPFAVVGDLQRTSSLEFWRESNDRERCMVVRKIAESHPAFLAITGDLVFDGSSPREWADFDALSRPLREAGIPVLAAFGNHEYWGGKDGEARLFARVPAAMGRHWYRLQYGPVALVIVDSNEAVLSDCEWQEQLRWYASTLDAIDRDPATRGALVFLHHSPFTNSTVTGDEPYVQRDFVAPMLRSRKVLAMLSGHVHSYERFVRDGRSFIVSGGGGGPRAMLATGNDRRHLDDLYAGPPLRDFHFTLYTPTPGGIVAEVLGVPKGGATLGTIDRFFLPWRL